MIDGYMSYVNAMMKKTTRYASDYLTSREIIGLGTSRVVITDSSSMYVCMHVWIAKNLSINLILAHTVMFYTDRPTACD
jgi:hypothetical protein